MRLAVSYRMTISEELNVFPQSSTLFFGFLNFFFFLHRESLAEDDSTQRGAGAGSPSFYPTSRYSSWKERKIKF